MALELKSFQERKIFPDMRLIDDKMIQQKQEIQNAPIRGPISPTKSSTKLMRQISALGMEDPIFSTTEDVPDHPSNIFADMGFDDVPNDMIDLMSVASDPTAARGAGLDESLLQLNLTCFMQTSSVLLDSSMDGSFKGIREEYKSNLFGSSQLIKDTNHSSGTHRGFSMTNDHGGTMSLPKRKMGTGTSHSHSTTQQGKAFHCHQSHSLRRKDGAFEGSDHLSFKKSSRHSKDQWNTSVPSLDTNGVFTSSNRKLFLDAKSNYSSNCAMNDPLMVEAALALEQYDQDKHQHGNSSVMLTSQHSCNNQYLAEKKVLSPPKERRLLPTLSGLFSP